MQSCWKNDFLTTNSQTGFANVDAYSFKRLKHIYKIGDGNKTYINKQKLSDYLHITAFFSLKQEMNIHTAS